MMPANSIIKTREDPGVAHFFRLDIVRYVVDLTPAHDEIRGLLVDVLKEPCAWLETAGIGVARKEGVLGIPSMTTLKTLIEEYSPPKVINMEGDGAGEIDEQLVADLDPDPPSDMDLEAMGEKPFVSKWEIVSRLAAVMRARHAVELVETQGLAALLACHEKQTALLDKHHHRQNVEGSCSNPLQLLFNFRSSQSEPINKLGLDVPLVTGFKWSLDGCHVQVDHLRVGELPDVLEIPDHLLCVPGGDVAHHRIRRTPTKSGRQYSPPR